MNLNVEIDKVKNRVPKWFLKKEQKNSKILLAYLSLAPNGNGIDFVSLENACKKIERFRSNFNQMVNYSEKNHGKVFEYKNGVVELWAPVKEFILMVYRQSTQSKLSKENDYIYLEEANFSFQEGHLIEIKINKYERSNKARQASIDYHGIACLVCGIDFEKIYGDLGRGFIHVHHITPLSNLKKIKDVDPIKDLVPVCPNCHSMLHKKEPPYTIDELKNKIFKNK